MWLQPPPHTPGRSRYPSFEGGGKGHRGIRTYSRETEKEEEAGLPCNFTPHTSLGSGEEKLGGKQNLSEGRSSCRDCKAGRYCRPAPTPDHPLTLKEMQDVL